MPVNILHIIYFVQQIFSSFDLVDFFDILIVAFVCYLILLFIKQTNSYVILNFSLVLVFLYYISTVFNLALVRLFFQPLLTFIIVILVVVFQSELRKFIRWLSAPTKFRFNSFLKISNDALSAILEAVDFMAEKKIGALIVFQGEQNIDDLLNGGFSADAKISNHLILSIFDSHTPGHDGAVIINNNRIRRFGVHLPLAENYTAYSKAGLRHRAGVGITEQSDVLAVIVSEERGSISFAENGQINQVVNIHELRKKILDFYKENETDELTWKNFIKKIIIRNFKTKFASFCFACLLWFFLVFQSGIVTKEIQVPIEIRFLPKNLIVEEVSFKNVDIVVSGNQKDLENFDPTKGNQVVIDGRYFKIGNNSVKLDKDAFSLPAYLNIKDFSPAKINVQVDKAPGEENNP